MDRVLDHEKTQAQRLFCWISVVVTTDEISMNTEGRTTIRPERKVSRSTISMNSREYMYKIA